LLQLCVIALDSDELYDSPKTGNPKIHLTGILEVALQLLPLDEVEVLDDIQEIVSNWNE